MKGMVIGGIGVFHVFVAQFAIGGGWLLCLLQWRAWKRGDALARRFLDSYFRVLVLISFVVGALTGVGMWLTSIQVSARTIGMMVDEFHWIWATEWLFFLAEVIAGYTFYRYAGRLTDGTRFLLLLVYSLAAWGSLFWINGILSWQLTPGGEPGLGSVWGGFFNPSFWPSLVYRSFVSLTLGGLAALAVVQAMKGITREERSHLARTCSLVLVPMTLMPLVGIWYVSVLPEDSRAWITGGSALMTMAFGIAVAASSLLGLYVVFGVLWKKLHVSFATATLLLGLAFGASGAGELVREGVRKPYTIRDLLYSNSLTQDDVEHFREHGSVQGDPWPLRDPAPTASLQTGQRVFRLQCSVCHTLNGANGVDHLVETWRPDQMRMNLASLQHTKSFMPPFAGTATELEALVQFLLWRRRGEPGEWTDTTTHEDLDKNHRWLVEATTAPQSHSDRSTPKHGGGR
ncbi:MAG: cytochrome ubiquinol oxidase subunit I [Planctomycetes bacterium]|nr:cytochrome ubiquinol oxidase subunit I [Planctomycetota bacterium]